MQTVNLNAVKREEGKGHAGRMRKTGAVPAVLYGKKFKASSISVNEKELELAVSTKSKLNVLLDLTIDGKDKMKVRIRDYQADQVTRQFTHVDFQVLDLKEKIMVEVPLQFVGKAKGVKEGGVLLMDRRLLSVKCLPTAIPENIEVDITELAIGDGIHVDELKLPEGIECPHEGNFSIVSVVAPMKEEEVAAPAVAAVEGAVPAEGAAPAAGTPGAAPGAAPAAAGAKPAPGAAPAAAGAKPAPGAAPAKK